MKAYERMAQRSRESRRSISQEEVLKRLAEHLHQRQLPLLRNALRASLGPRAIYLMAIPAVAKSRQLRIRQGVALTVEIRGVAAGDGRFGPVSLGAAARLLDLLEMILPKPTRPAAPACSAAAREIAPRPAVAPANQNEANQDLLSMDKPGRSYPAATTLAAAEVMASLPPVPVTALRADGKDNYPENLFSAPEVTLARPSTFYTKAPVLHAELNSDKNAANDPPVLSREEERQFGFREWVVSAHDRAEEKLVSAGETALIWLGGCLDDLSSEENKRRLFLAILFGLVAGALLAVLTATWEALQSTLR